MLEPGAMRPHRKRIQMIFQDPYASLNPRLPAGTHRRRAAGELPTSPAARSATSGSPRCSSASACGADAMRKLPARILRRPAPAPRHRPGARRVNPDVIVADEPVSALDVSVQAQVLNLLIDLQDELGLAYLFISARSRAWCEHISHRIAVMYLGRIVELADKRTLFATPLHPYTEALLAAAPLPIRAPQRKKRDRAEGDVPSPTNPPPGCRFHTRCPYAFAAAR